MRRHLRYLAYVLRHKWFVLLAGRRTGAPFGALLVHDASKMGRSEWGPYVSRFYGGAPADRGAAGEWKRRQRAAFDSAWLHHQQRNAHHWQYHLHLAADVAVRHATAAPACGAWTEAVGQGLRPLRRTRLLVEDSGRVRCLRCGATVEAREAGVVAREIPEPLVREMVADWMGAGRAITGRWDVAEWYARSGGAMILHPATRRRAEQLLAEHGGVAGSG